MALDTQMHTIRAAALLESVACRFYGLGLVLSPEDGDSTVSFIADWRPLADAIGRAARGKPYTGGYVKNLLLGRQKFTSTFMRGVEEVNLSLNGELQKLRSVNVGEVTVRVVDGLHVEKGSLILVDSKICICGISFVPSVYNQDYHSPDCKKLARRLRRLEKRK
jgi:hypothetical protein